MSDYKYLQVRLPASLHEEFYKAFPGFGERSRLIIEVVALLTEEGRRKDVLPREVVTKLRKRITEGDDE